MKTVFMGTPDFAAVVLDSVVKAGFEVGYVITQPDKARDRGKKIQFTPVKEKALEYGLEVLQPEKVRENAALLEQLQEYRPDIIIVVAYGQILPKELLELPELGCVNVHASLLPKLRGASPIQNAIVTGETVTGVTIMQMGEGLDTGDMLTQVEVEIGRMNGEQLHDALAEAGAKLLVETLPKLEAGQITPQPQDDSQSTYAGLIRKADGKIDFRKTPEEIERLIRGFDPWPGAFCDCSGTVMKLWAAQPLNQTCEQEPGTVLRTGEEGMDVSCGGRILRVTEIQMPGKKRVFVKDYLRGNSIASGTLLK
ncbi:MAG: methionyl-tRNA formyltransferase [Anaerovoracaceae bacterium]|nr:methionyl-tRNA formyltransferase [Anaerovoracaceae bacterium]